MLSEQEWEALCNKCGGCCYLWTDNNTRSKTEACVLLDKETKCCIEYEDRFKKKLDAYAGHRCCVKINEQDMEMYCATKFLPNDCAYIQYYLRNTHA